MVGHFGMNAIEMHHPVKVGHVGDADARAGAARPYEDSVPAIVQLVRKRSAGKGLTWSRGGSRRYGRCGAIGQAARFVLRFRG